jgi:F-type H+-transporting ATPase subunit a
VKQFLKAILVSAFLIGTPFVASAAENHATTAKPVVGELAHQPEGAPHGGEQHGLPAAAPRVFKVGPVEFTSSMILTWIVAAILILVAQLATRNIQLVPRGLQNFVEWLVEGMYGFFQEILGAHLAKKAFWFFCTIFIFILFTNWFGLIPGVGTVGWGEYREGHFHIVKPLLRGGNADLNMTLAMALVFFFLWFVWSLQELGPGGFIKHIFGGAGTGGGVMGLFISAIFLVVGIIEVVSIAFRPVSLSFRLYGNIFAGENILESMMTLVPWLGWILPVPFYFLELLVGLVQALVFALLTSVFTALMAGHHEEGHGHEKEHGQAAAH